eukprot:SAG22_NODE_1022_length_5991_cov_3.875424_3_plen_423_part_00
MEAPQKGSAVQLTLSRATTRPAARSKPNSFLSAVLSAIEREGRGGAGEGGGEGRKTAASGTASVRMGRAETQRRKEGKEAVGREGSRVIAVLPPPPIRLTPAAVDRRPAAGIAAHRPDPGGVLGVQHLTDRRESTALDGRTAEPQQKGRVGGVLGVTVQHRRAAAVAGRGPAAVGSSVRAAGASARALPAELGWVLPQHDRLVRPTGDQRGVAPVAVAVGCPRVVGRPDKGHRARAGRRVRARPGQHPPRLDAADVPRVLPQRPRRVRPAAAAARTAAAAAVAAPLCDVLAQPGGIDQHELAGAAQLRRRRRKGCGRQAGRANRFNRRGRTAVVEPRQKCRKAVPYYAVLLRTCGQQIAAVAPAHRLGLRARQGHTDGNERRCLSRNSSGSTREDVALLTCRLPPPPPRTAEACRWLGCSTS